MGGWRHRFERQDAVAQAQRALNMPPALPDFYNIVLERPSEDTRDGCNIFELFLPLILHHWTVLDHSLSNLVSNFFLFFRLSSFVCCSCPRCKS